MRPLQYHPYDCCRGWTWFSFMQEGGPKPAFHPNKPAPNCCYHADTLPMVRLEYDLWVKLNMLILSFRFWRTTFSGSHFFRSSYAGWKYEGFLKQIYRDEIFLRSLESNEGDKSAVHFILRINGTFCIQFSNLAKKHILAIFSTYLSRLNCSIYDNLLM